MFTDVAKVKEMPKNCWWDKRQTWVQELFSSITRSLNQQLLTQLQSVRLSGVLRLVLVLLTLYGGEVTDTPAYIKNLPRIVAPPKNDLFPYLIKKTDMKVPILYSVGALSLPPVLSV